MEELKNIEKADLLAGWGTASTLLAKASDLAEQMGRDDIFNMLSDSFDLMENAKGDEIFFNVFQFCYRIYYRMKSMVDKDMPINRVTLEHRGNDDVYVVSNYDYKMFLWAKSKGFGDTINNLQFVVSPSSLTPAELHRFEKQAEK